MTSKNSLDIRKIIFSEIEFIRKKNKSTGKFNLRDKTPLFGGRSGLDSLDIAELIVKLEEKFGVDPFKEASSTRSTRTFGDLIRFYAKHARRKA